MKLKIDKKEKEVVIKEGVSGIEGWVGENLVVIAATKREVRNYLKGKISGFERYRWSNDWRI